eukprot:Tbor_TRINITY_DN5340_c1_g1::TRINITY_DN5340_c1_g1_i1::g.4442::m.4442/K15371/GDH2; glutamate dehydrogenase
MEKSISEALLSQKGSLFDGIKTKEVIADFFKLQFDPTYVVQFNEAEITRHVYGYMCARANKAAGNNLRYEQEDSHEAFYICCADHKEQMHVMTMLEVWLNARHAQLGKSHAISIKSFHSRCMGSATDSMILLVAEMCPFIDPSGKGKEYRDLTHEKFMNLRSEETRKRYENIVQRLNDSIQPVYTVNTLEKGLLSLKAAFIPDRVSYLTALVTLINSINGASVVKKFCETLSNGIHVYTFYVSGASVDDLNKAAGLIGMLPHSPKRITTIMYNEKLIDANEVIFFNALVTFAFYFTPPTNTEDYGELSHKLRHNPMSIARLKNLRSEMLQQIMSTEFIMGVIRDNVGLVKAMYQDFVTGSTPESLTKLQLMCDQQLRNACQHTRSIMRSFITFIKSVLKTNFFKVSKAAVAFRLDPAFISDMDYPRVPYGIFMIIGPQFTGFHVRFTDIARGGIRMILSRQGTHEKNFKTLFAENYNLAYTQLLKNKDIPEGGSKGTIMVAPNATYDNRRIFLQYVDAIMDLLIPGVEGVRSYIKSPEILFFGPDENTAGEFPAFATLHAKKRGYKQWKSFMTGKSQKLGGIPHDTYGMTSRGVRAYVEQIYEKFQLNESNLTKVQTAGPDGDLGSNEILLSKEKYIAIVDGSGSLYDPEGLNRDELTRLAKARLSISHFDNTKLSSLGFFIGIQEKNRTLPDGTLVEDGEVFRNTYHFSKFCVADTFVPCGGRPATINLDNVHNMVIGVPGVTGQAMIDGKVGNLLGTSKLRYKFVVEGANLFITHNARIAMENIGVVLIKDSSSNKGGVTCSSLEVLSGLLLTAAEHGEHMCVGNTGELPKFYSAYVDEVIQIIGRNAKLEFECIWKAHKKGVLQGKITLISDAISSKIVEIRRFISNSDLHNDTQLFIYVLRNYIPQTLQQKVSIDQVLVRVPINYLRAIFAMWIASDFVYKTGITDSNEFGFFVYMHELAKKANASSKM